jgi:hypothetical protein
MGGLCNTVSPQFLKFLKCCYPFQFLKRSKFAAGVRSDDSIIYSTTSPLHRFYYIQFASVRSFDPIPAASAVFIDYITLPLRGNPIHIVCDIPYRPIVSIFANTCRTH